MILSRILCAAFVVTLTGCTTTSLPETDASLCNELDRYAATVPNGAASTIRLARGGSWMVDHYKKCESPPNDLPAHRLCEWLFKNSSTEFMEANVARALSCLQRQTIKGYVGNTTLESWSGSASFNRAVFPNSDAALVVTWQVGCPACREDFLQFEVVAPEGDER
jgi:hypothetical protein